MVLETFLMHLLYTSASISCIWVVNVTAPLLRSRLFNLAMLHLIYIYIEFAAHFDNASVVGRREDSKIAQHSSMLAQGINYERRI
jgi:hypothetical protein